jgi:thymidylate kinase
VSHSEAAVPRPTDRPIAQAAGPIIEILGIDGAGKSTLVREASIRFGATARKVAPFSPDLHNAAIAAGAALGSHIKDAMRGWALASALVVEASRPTPGLSIFDRYIESAKMFLAVHDLPELPTKVLGSLPPPDLVVLLDLDLSIALSRRAPPAAGSRSDAELPFLHACQRYLRSTAKTSGWLTLDAQCPVRELLAMLDEPVAELVNRPSSAALVQGST